MDEFEEKQMQELRKDTKPYISAIYLGLISAFFVLLVEFFIPVEQEIPILIGWAFLFHGFFCYRLGKTSGSQAMLVGFIMAIPIAAVTYWIPSGLAHSHYSFKEHLVFIPLMALVAGILGQIYGQLKSHKPKKLG